MHTCIHTFRFIQAKQQETSIRRIELDFHRHHRLYRMECIAARPLSYSVQTGPVSGVLVQKLPVSSTHHGEPKLQVFLFVLCMWSTHTF